jgi:hypothetical protein
VKNTGYWLVFLLILAFSPRAWALIDIAGIVETGNSQIDMDSLTWYLMSSPGPITESTPNWGGPAGTTDTFQFLTKPEWPFRTRIFYRVNGLPYQHIIEPLLPDTWYELPSYDLQGPRVRFEDTILQGLQTPEQMPEYQNLQITPNPARGGRVWLELANATVEVYCITGNRCPVRLNQDGRRVSIDISHLQSGVYLIRVKGNGFELSRKLLLIN